MARTVLKFFLFLSVSSQTFAFSERALISSAILDSAAETWIYYDYFLRDAFRQFAGPSSVEYFDQVAWPEFIAAWQAEQSQHDRSRTQAVLKSWGFSSLQELSRFSEKHQVRLKSRSAAVLLDFYREITRADSLSVLAHDFDKLDSFDDYYRAYTIRNSLRSIDALDFASSGNERELSILLAIALNNHSRQIDREQSRPALAGADEASFVSSLRLLAQKGDGEGIRLAMIAYLVNPKSTKFMETHGIRGRSEKPRASAEKLTNGDRKKTGFFIYLFNFEWTPEDFVRFAAQGVYPENIASRPRSDSRLARLQSDLRHQAFEARAVSAFVAKCAEAPARFRHDSFFVKQ